MRRDRGHLGIAFALALLAPACNREDPRVPAEGRAGSALTFSISLAEDERDAVRELLRRFEAEHDTPVRLISITAADLPERLKVDVAAGRPTIDLFAQDNLALRVLVDEGLVEDLADAPIPDPVIPLLRPPRFDGRQYFLPFRPNVEVTYVNRARFREAGVDPPTTVEELRAAARRLKVAGRDVPRITLSLAQGAPAAVTIAAWIVGFGGDPLVLDDPGSIRAFEFLQGLWQDGLLARESLLAQYDTQVDFLLGETAWLAANWPFTSGILADQDLLDRFDVYAGWRGPVRAAHVVGGDVLGVPRGITGHRRQAALALAAFLMSRDAQEFLVEKNAWPSIRADAYGRAPAGQRKTFEAIRQALADGWLRPSVPHWSVVSEAMNEAVRRIVVGGEPARPVLNELGQRVKAAARRAGVGGATLSAGSRPG